MKRVKMFLVYQGSRGEEEALKEQIPQNSKKLEKVVDGFIREGRAMDYLEDWMAEMETNLDPFQYTRRAERIAGQFGSVEYLSDKGEIWCRYEAHSCIVED